MINLDMVGRLRENRATILGATSAAEWPELDRGRLRRRAHRMQRCHRPAASAPAIRCRSTRRAFRSPISSPDRTATITSRRTFPAASTPPAPRRSASRSRRWRRKVAARAEPLTLQRLPSPPPEGDARSFNASLGTIPDYAGPPAGTRGVLLAGVRPGGAAEKAGLRRGDLLVKLGTHDIGSVEDLMYALNASKPGETVAGADRPRRASS